MQFDTASQTLKCRYCGNEKILEDGTEEEPEEYELNFADEDDSSLKDWGTEQQLIKCSNCSGEMLLPATQTAAVCGFCGSPKVLPQGNPGSIRPESLIPFQISRDQAAQAFNLWRKGKWFIPNQFKKRSVNSNLNGIYVPYWTFDTNTDSSYKAEVGVYHYRDETRTRVVNGKSETYTERVRYTVWHWTNGNYEQFYDDMLIPASEQYDSILLQKLNDFELDQLTPYKPEYLSGFIAERYTVSLEAGWEQAKSRVDTKLESEIRSEIGGDEIRKLDIRTRYIDRTYKHILLPVWIANYMYKNNRYRYMVNGESGSVTGYVPRSPWKIMRFIVICLLIATFFSFWIADAVRNARSSEGSGLVHNQGPSQELKNNSPK
ncbi:hypothetical protein Back11_43670 [Paenibacillus baekrokdamisoli]|uniref:Uncharacterized protein n=1 Tax=Paenibacillus baekrokdamisoli TaxID=1712516 RepID=A0A3G9IXG4_9BACL|nr:hypothetical protein [Paenibacillus baekrokdamisoli]MBB3067931.1 DNA-directed RNA polymerase subunit RPC12/RpoP [Paenibacillus baekrokdamisoli]BBH23022.1 hypothetical protein Back11_43670 [Paenibacillus baekrokdamisoli]